MFEINVIEYRLRVIIRLLIIDIYEELCCSTLCNGIPLYGFLRLLRKACGLLIDGDEDANKQKFCARERVLVSSVIGFVMCASDADSRHYSSALPRGSRERRKTTTTTTGP